MPSEKAILDSAQKSLDIRLRRLQGKPAVGTPAVLNDEGAEITPASEDYKPAVPGLQEEFDAASAAVARATSRRDKAKAAIESNEMDVRKYRRILVAFSAFAEDDAETAGDDTMDTDETPLNTENTDDVPADGQGIAEEIATPVQDTTDEAPVIEAKSRRGGRGRVAVSE